MADKLKHYLQQNQPVKDALVASSEAGQRFELNIDHLREQDQELCKYIIEKPAKAIQILEQQLQEYLSDLRSGDPQKVARSADDAQFPAKQEKHKVNFEGSLGRNYVTPRGLKANLLNQLVKVQGIVT